MIYAILIALAWGAADGYLRGPYWIVVAGALIAGGLCLWFERKVLLKSAPEPGMNRNLLIAPAYAFVAMVALGLAGLAYAGGMWLHHH
jgi:cell division protein FtsX